jgi:hypothetical protein
VLFMSHSRYVTFGYSSNIPAETSVRLMRFMASLSFVLDTTINLHPLNSFMRVSISRTYFPVLPYPIIITLSAIEPLLPF